MKYVQKLLLHVRESQQDEVLIQRVEWSIVGRQAICASSEVDIDLVSNCVLYMSSHLGYRANVLFYFAVDCAVMAAVVSVCPAHSHFRARISVIIRVTMKSVIFWDTIPYSLVEVDQYFKGMFCLHIQD